MIDIGVKKWLNGADGRFLLDVNLNIKKGEFVCIYGKSGSGKTTILRMLAGFETPDSGKIVVDDEIFFDYKFSLAPQKRNIGFLFQDYALFENMSVVKNLLFAKNDKNLAYKFLDIMDLLKLKDSDISNLSGGQKQRVALARALMREPNILLLDEPLSALDTSMRQKLQDYLLRIHNELNITSVIVSHDVAEIYRLCSKVFVLQNGLISDIKTPKELFLKHSGSQKLAFNAKILEIKQSDGVYVALVLVANQLCKVVLSTKEAFGLVAGDDVVLSTKAFGLTIKK